MSESIIKAAERLHEPGSDPFDASIHEASLLLAREAVNRLGWGTMTYQCKACGFEWRIWLSLGCEGPHALREAGLYLAVPFMGVRCPAWPSMQRCDGEMSHVRWKEDEEFEPRLIPDDAPRFVLPYSASRGDTGARLEIPGPALVAARRAMNEPVSPDESDFGPTGGGKTGADQSEPVSPDESETGR